MGSTVLGWSLIVVGILSLLFGLVAFIQAQFFEPDRQSLPQFTNFDLQVIAELLDKIARILESFTRLSLPVQWALIGLICIALGTYLLANKPF
jgi:uncharacterized membrane protein HdeD (DUF308 family)